MSTFLPANVHAFLLERIDSLEELEILLLLWRERRAWTPEEVAREIRTQPQLAKSRLTALAGHSLMREEKPGSFRYAPTPPSLDADVAAVSAAYGNLRLSVINLISAKHLERIKSFASAFRLKGDGK